MIGAHNFKSGFVMLMVTHGPNIFRPGVYLRSFIADANNGHGEVSFTENPKEAMVFPTHGAAMEFWNRQATINPIRPDGKPNKPLTAFTVEITPAQREIDLHNAVNL